MSFRSGFVAVVGKPNVGKSSLVNALVGKKVSIVSPKAQTTRDKIMGVMNTPNEQVIFIDTPGIHQAKNNLDRYMQDAVSAATADVDVLLYVMDGSRDFSEDDLRTLQGYCGQGYPVFVVVNKVDLGSFASIYPRLDRLNKISGIAEVFGVSALKSQNLDDLKAAILDKLTDDTKYFPDEEFTDKSVEFRVAETIREKILWMLNDEVPHGVGVVVSSIDLSAPTLKISATIYCERASHKNIIVGAKGSVIKEIGTKSRLAIQKMLSKPVYLDLFVKVKQNWRDRVNLSELGYDQGG